MATYRKTKPCVSCKKIFEMAYGQSHSRWEKQQFCSKQCQGVYNRKSQMIEGTKNCALCSAPFVRYPRLCVSLWNAQKFCSKSCAGKYRKPFKEQPTKDCLICGTTFSKPSKQKESWWESAKYCSKTCYEIEASVFMETLRYRGKENWVWRKKVLERDGNECRMKSKKCNGNLTVHHVLRYSEFPELRYEINNGITLCKYHHPLKRVEEEKMIPVFNNLIQNYGN